LGAIHNPTGLKAEGYGAKAGMLFLIHCFKYCNVPIPEGQFTFYCNNEGLLKKLKYMQSYNNAINGYTAYPCRDPSATTFCATSAILSIKVPMASGNF
jgi:hypothetical protein